MSDKPTSHIILSIRVFDIIQVVFSVDKDALDAGGPWVALLSAKGDDEPADASVWAWREHLVHLQACWQTALQVLHKVAHRHTNKRTVTNDQSVNGYVVDSVTG